MTYFPMRNIVEVREGTDRERREATRENSARTATVEMTYLSDGVGQHRIAKPLEFPICFRSEPHLSTGCATIRQPATKSWNDPIGTQGIWAWHVDSRGFFVGAFIWLRVEIYPVDVSQVGAKPPSGLVTQHYFTFTGIGTKDIPTNGVSQKLTPHAVTIYNN